jgi:6-pyruvoyltetrahydropterin/6-carboxytetrahydropterin synthase
MTSDEPCVVAYLGLGSNLGDRLANLRRAIDLISNRVTVVRHSRVYETEPVGVPDQGRFLNMVVEAKTNRSPDQLMHFFKGIEQELGRGNAASDAPRPIDIDILFYDERIVSTDSITIPHPRLAQRAFVLVPLNDLSPKLEHPLTHRTVAEMLSALDNTQGVELISASLPSNKQNHARNRGTAMYYVNVEDHFDAAHFLRGYSGKCENLHGHRYKVAVKLSSFKLNQVGLAYDFSDLKAVLKPILARYDHILLNDLPPFDKINPSAENIARTIYEEIKPKIVGAKLESVTIWESPESSVEYRED